MDPCAVSPLRRRIFVFSCLLLFVQAVLTHDTRGHHSRIARAYKSKTYKRDKEPRKSKFSNLGIFGIRGQESSTAKISNTYIGVIPDAGDTGGYPQTLKEIIKSLGGKKPAVVGWYAHVYAGHPFKGEQLFEIKDQLKEAKCVFSPAIMPHGSWQGFTYQDNSQAVRVAKILRQFTDENIPIIVRFAHEVNWYQRTGECPGNAENFKEGWDVFAKAVRKYCPDCYTHWTPNVDSMEQYKKYAPYNMDETVDLVGVDWYPTKRPSAGDFVKRMKEFHDTYAINGRKFALGEAGLHYEASYKDRVDWLTQIASSRDQLPQLVYAIWYNSKKEFNYKLAGNGLSTTLLTEKLE